MITQQRIVTEKTDARKKFGRFKPDPPKQVRRARVERNNAVEQITDAVKELDAHIVRKSSDVARGRDKGRLVDMIYEKAAELAAGIECNANDITAFSLTMHENEKEMFFATSAGMVISALINKSEDQDHLIHAEFLTGAIAFVGYRNTKNITIEGKCNFIGYEMTAGKIIVNGNAMSRIGREMKGGEIHIMGAYTSLDDDIKGGKIFHNGRLVWPDY